jgi:hypothetical protein
VQKKKKSNDKKNSNGEVSVSDSSGRILRVLPNRSGYMKSMAEHEFGLVAVVCDSKVRLYSVQIVIRLYHDIINV